MQTYINTENGQLAVETLCFCLSRCINKLAKENCYGCQIDHPSQRNHTCLGIDYHLNPIDLVEIHFDDVWTESDRLIKQFITQMLLVSSHTTQKLEVDEELLKDSLKCEAYFRVKERFS